MSKYFFIIGRNRDLSFAEILSVFSKKNISFNHSVTSSETAIFSFENSQDLGELVKCLGGTVKIGKIIDEIDLDESERKLDEIFAGENLINCYFEGVSGKIHFGVSIYFAEDGINNVAQFNKLLPYLNGLIKDNLAGIGKRSGFLRIKERYLSSVSVAKNQLLTHGAEIVVLVTHDKLLIGKTLSVQEFGRFAFRDMGRPERDKKSGIMPPKLARMMINLAEIDNNCVLLDPFCGSGTILQEAVILGYKNIIGSDISNKAISDTRNNLDWLFKYYQGIDRSSYNIKLQQADVSSINKYFSYNTIDAIITEPYLGPPLHKQPGINQIKRFAKELETLYSIAFAQFTKILHPGGKVVMIFPVFESNNQLVYIEILEKITHLGFIQNELLESQRRTITYGDKSQFLKREIISFIKR